MQVAQEPLKMKKWFYKYHFNGTNSFWGNIQFQWSIDGSTVGSPYVDDIFVGFPKE